MLLTYSHFLFSQSPISSPFWRTVSTSWATCDSGPPMVKSSMYPTRSSLASHSSSGWIALQNRSGPNGSPC